MPITVYKSIEASKTMLEALEREDSGILMLMLGEWERGREIISSADSVFVASFEIAKNNLTEFGEEEYISKIETKYLTYKSNWQRPIVDTDKQGNIVWYKNVIHRLFLETKQAVNELMTLNQTIMYNEATIIKEKSKRALMPGIVAIIAALVFSIMLNMFITRYFVNPILELADAVDNYQDNNKKLNCNITSNDEIKQLEQSITQLIQRLVKPD